MNVESPRVCSHLQDRQIYTPTIELMSAADREMRKALQGVDAHWALEFSWELSQAVAQLVQITEVELQAREQRLQLLGHVVGCLDNVPNRRPRRRALRVLKRLARDAEVVAGRAVRPAVVFDGAVKAGR